MAVRIKKKKRIIGSKTMTHLYRSPDKDTSMNRDNMSHLGQYDFHKVNDAQPDLSREDNVVVLHHE